MQRVFLLICTIALFAACASFDESSDDPEKAELHLRIGTSLLENGSYPQAMTELTEAENLHSKNPVIQNNLGLVYFAREKYETAEKHLVRAVKLKSDYTDAKNNLGRLWIEMKKYPEADKILREATEDLTYTSPEKIYLNLGLSAFRQNHLNEARTLLLKSLDFQRGNCLAQTLYGRVLFEQKDFSRAAATLDRAVGFCSGGVIDEPQYYGALAYYEMGDSRKAEARLEELMKLYPTGAYYERSRSMLETMRK